MSVNAQLVPVAPRNAEAPLVTGSVQVRVNVTPTVAQVKNVAIKCIESAGTCFTLAKVAKFIGFSKVSTISNAIGAVGLVAGLVAGVRVVQMQGHEIERLRKENERLEGNCLRLVNQTADALNAANSTVRVEEV